jgi:pseudouridine synthase
MKTTQKRQQKPRLKNNTHNKMRIQRFIALNTGYSRRKAENLIEEKKVKLNGKTVFRHGVLVDPLKDSVEIDGKIVEREKKYKYLILNKPAGYITTKKDAHAKKTVMDLIPFKDLHPVGRLDKNTEGLIILTNDGDLTYKLTHPKFEHEKEYLVKTKKPLTEEMKNKLEKGIMLSGKKTAPAKVKKIKRTGPERQLTLIIHEGRKRQIRRMFEEIENPVIYLKRTRISGITLGDLKKGKYRYLTPDEIRSLKK